MNEVAMASYFVFNLLGRVFYLCAPRSLNQRDLWFIRARAFRQPATINSLELIFINVLLFQFPIDNPVPDLIDWNKK